MRLRTKILLYFIAVHLLLAAAAVFVFFENRLLLLVMEVLFASSVIVSYRLVTALFIPLDLIRTGTELMGERDFTSHFVKVGQPEMDALIDVYNRMIDELREERLRAREQRELVGRIVQASPSGVVICDFDGRVVQVNPSAQRLLGSGASGVNGRALRELGPPIGEALAQLTPGHPQLLSLPGGRRLKLSRVEFRDRGFLKSFYLLEELTDELRLSEKAAYEKLIRMMSHEVNNSVGAVRSLLESSLTYASQLGEEDRGDFTTALAVAGSRLENLNRFMNGFADVVRIPPPDRRPCDLRELVTDVVTLMRPDLETRGITLRAELDGASIVTLDKNQLEQVLINVVKNAAESIGRDGTVAITLHHDARRILLSIADSGPGIAADTQQQMFTPFFTTKKDGRGIGLTVVQEILKNHAFDFTLENREQGGAELTIEIPAM
jgi:nitrogen fixation/metabolism regulation signal transduction histidine kinase